MSVRVVAIEYAGPDIEIDIASSRLPVLEHADDIDTGLLAHGDDQLRVGFPRPTRGWPMPTQVTRCTACTLAVTALITGLVADVVGRTVTDLTRWAIRLSELAARSTGSRRRRGMHACGAGQFTLDRSTGPLHTVRIPHPGDLHDQLDPVQPTHPPDRRNPARR